MLNGRPRDQIEGKLAKGHMAFVNKSGTPIPQGSGEKVYVNIRTLAATLGFPRRDRIHKSWEKEVIILFRSHGMRR